MDDLEDELDLRFHRGLKPDVYYRCPTLESLDGALRNELEKNAASLIPVEIVTEFVFAAASTVTIATTQQPNLDALIEPADHLQSIAVDHVLCRDIDGKDRLKIQRAIARSIIEAIQDIDGFKYSERSAQNKEGGDGARLKYVCQASLQNRRNRIKKEKQKEAGGSGDHVDVENPTTYDCAGAIHVKFSLSREAINVVYHHNPIHTQLENGESNLPPLGVEPEPATESATPKATKPQKRKHTKQDQADVQNAYTDPDLGMATSPETAKASTKSRRKGTASTPGTSRKSSAKKSKNPKSALSPTAKRNKSLIDDSPAPEPPRNKPCLRCKEMKIKCNAAQPTCNQCQRGLWTCQYEGPTKKKRSKTGCINCKQRKRKCTEERPSCTYCIRLDEDCEYADAC